MVQMGVGTGTGTRRTQTETIYGNCVFQTFGRTQRVIKQDILPCKFISLVIPIYPKTKTSYGNCVFQTYSNTKSVELRGLSNRISFNERVTLVVFLIYSKTKTIYRNCVFQTFGRTQRLIKQNILPCKLISLVFLI